MAVLLLGLLCLLLLPRKATAADEGRWHGSLVERGYVLKGGASHTENALRECSADAQRRLVRQASIPAPEGGWPGTPQAVVVFNIFSGDVLIEHGIRKSCGQMFDMRTRDSRFRAGVGLVVVPRAGDTAPIRVAWETPLLPELVPTVRLGEPSQLQFEDTARFLVRTACMAILVALALSAVMGWLATRDVLFLFYTSGCLVLFLWQAINNGMGGYPYPWLAMESAISELQVGLGLLSTVLMLVALWFLCGGRRWLAGSVRWARRITLATSLVALSVATLPVAGLQAVAMATSVILVAGIVALVMLVLVIMLRNWRHGVLGLFALIPFIAMVLGEVTSAFWWVEYRIEVQQLVATSLLIITAYALNQRLGLLRLQRDEMRRLAETDGLTGLPNRRAGMDQLERLFAQAKHQGMPLTVAFLDVDHFKSINDTAGHEAGDLVLSAVARLLSESVRNDDCVARMGGEEFMVLLPDMSGLHAQMRMESVREQVALLAFSEIAVGLRVTVSIGVAELSDTDRDAESLLRRADQAMYLAKQSGRDRVQLG